ncbi:Cytosolic phospholipase A2 beta [Saguinus oedipus]|uniref:Cytosolic phospholipase A2 beta n=1 Tax=Saguinus oedipus TaxID=9490 RepID=A0ABQ9V311_SAGOE|nr:Cytosolic phospholipase A2 beta [Saguinus oedipus]
MALAGVSRTCLLTVRVLQAHRLPSKDLVTPSDCYVTVWLPTACSNRLQTRTVKNSSSPVWNQSFHFRIHRQLKVGPLSEPALPTSPPAIAAALLTFPFPPFTALSLCSPSRMSWN